MDRQRRNLIVFGAALMTFVTSALAQTPIQIREASWLSEDGQLEALSEEPAFDREAVLTAASNSPLASQFANGAALERDVLVGEFLFRTPLLLGGQAAKAGISCQSCHVNGRGNPHFQFPAISGEPGTADTTHNFFSKSLGNDADDPVAIPDLTQPGKVSHDLESGELEQFIANIVVEEFSGRESAQAFIQPLASFVRALRLSARISRDNLTALEQRSASREWTNITLMVDYSMDRSMKQLQDTGSDPDSALHILILSGARSRLALIHERLLPGKSDPERAWLVTQSQALASLQSVLRKEHSTPAQLAAAYAVWESNLSSQPDFAALNGESLYDRVLLAASLKGVEASNFAE